MNDHKTQNIKDIKKKLRKNLLKKRRSLSDSIRLQASNAIQKSLFELPIFRDSKVIHVYLNQSEEVQTMPVIQHCWASGKVVVVPYIVNNTGYLGHSILESFDDLKQGKFNIAEPISSRRKPIDKNTIDLVLLPGVGFDLNGNRLGYGGGYYDIFLSQLSSFFLGLAFEIQIIDYISPESHDVTLNGLITESRVEIFKCNKNITQK